MKDRKINPFVIFSIIGSVLIMFLLYNGFNNKSEFEEAYNKNQKQIANLEATLEKQKGDRNKRVEEMNPELFFATSEGVRVANFQNEIGQITDFTEDKDEKMFELNKDVKPLFKDGIGATSVWFYPGSTAGDNSFTSTDRLKYKWTFNSTFSTIRDDYPVLWTCRVSDSGIEDDGKLLAFALAKYDGDKHQFYNSKVYYTNLGNKYVGSNLNQDDNLRIEKRDLNYEDPNKVKEESKDANKEKLRKEDDKPLRDESYEQLWGGSGDN